MAFYASWVHGHNVQLERRNAPAAKGKSSVRDAFAGDPGDIVDLGGHGAAACLRIGWAARFVIFDSGSEDKEKSGSFWVHYGIPTPVIERGERAEADTVLINYESTDINEISINAVHVWDGNRRIFVDDSPVASSDDFNGGISGAASSGTPDVSRLWRGDIPRQPIFFGLGVSLRIRAQRARNNFLEIRSVGIDFQIAD